MLLLAQWVFVLFDAAKLLFALQTLQLLVVFLLIELLLGFFRLRLLAIRRIGLLPFDLVELLLHLAGALVALELFGLLLGF